MNVYQRLNAARQEFHSLALKKSGHNKFAGYDYFELGDFLIPALRIFATHGLCAIVSFEKETATMTIRNAADPADCAVITSPMGSAALKGCHEVQNVGAVETYQRRYLWVAALEIVEHDALDATTAKGDQKPRKPDPAGAGQNGSDIAEAHMRLLDEDTQRYVRAVAADVVGKMPDGRAALEALELAALDNEGKLALWGLLDSATRSALKKAKEA